MALNCHIFFQYITDISLGAYMRPPERPRALLYLCTHKIQMQLIFMKAADTNKHEILMYPPVVFRAVRIFLTVIHCDRTPLLALQDFI